MVREGSQRRHRGILTPDDREAIEGTTRTSLAEALGPEAMRQARYRIRERIKQALRDLSFLFYHLPPRDRKQVFEEFMNGSDRDQFRNVFQLFFLGIYDSAEAFEPPYDEEIDDPIAVIEWFVRNGIAGTEWELGGYQSDVWVDIEVDRWRPDPEAAYERAFAGYADNAELAYLSRWHDEMDFPERVIETGEPIRFVRGPASKFGSKCVQEFTPEDARVYLESEDDPPEGEGRSE